MPEQVFTGVGVALATLFDDDGEVDAKATAGLAATLVDLGVRGVVVAGSTGEAAALTAGERVALLTETRRAVP
ncbi:MAG TPA: dihydrodipicolinate synthase family protein, partial [Actinomycetes bacterium]|nr:dihydrodipicolinate synthase family protein [Actinomycetes bacterium]